MNESIENEIREEAIAELTAQKKKERREALANQIYSYRSSWYDQRNALAKESEKITGLPFTDEEKATLGNLRGLFESCRELASALKNKEQSLADQRAEIRQMESHLESCGREEQKFATKFVESFPDIKQIEMLETLTYNSALDKYVFYGEGHNGVTSIEKNLGGLAKVASEAQNLEPQLTRAKNCLELAESEYKKMRVQFVSNVRAIKKILKTDIPALEVTLQKRQVARRLEISNKISDLDERSNAELEKMKAALEAIG